MNADLLPDFVVTRICDDNTVGSSHWLVYPGTGSSFAEPPVRVAMPSGYPADSFRYSEGAASCGAAPGRHAFTLQDIDGDRRPDLVVTSACDDPTVGTTHWRVYTGAASSFASTPTRFPLPSGFVDGAFASFNSTSDCPDRSSRTRAAVLDLTGDQRPDLVVTRGCDDGPIGPMSWRVYVNTGSAFADTPTRFTLPSGYPRETFQTTLAGASCSGTYGQPAFSLHDMDGDRRPDVVVHKACDDPSVGGDHWRVYANTGAAFATTPARFTLPSGFTATTFQTIGAASQCADMAGRPAFVMLDMNADRRPDLLVTRVCDDPTVGDTHWRVYEGTGFAFAGAPARLTLPAGFPSGLFRSVAGTAVCPGSTDIVGHQLVDLSADLRPDLVFTRACGDDAVGTSRWLIHHNVCR